MLATQFLSYRNISNSILKETKKDWLLLKNLKSTGMVNVESDLYLQYVLEGLWKGKLLERPLKELNGWKL